jgi:hypothetical protein
MPLRVLYVAVAILAGVVGLALDFYVIAGTLIVSPTNPVARSLPNMLVYYWTFLTNLSNLGLILVYLADLTKWRWLSWFHRPSTRAGLAGIMVLVMGFYHFMLAPQYHFTGPIVWSNYLLHYVTPLLYLGWWLMFTEHGTLRYRQLPMMLVPGLAYVGYVLVRGLIAGEYPYTILDPTWGMPGSPAQGYLGVAIGVAMLLIMVAAFDLLLTFVDGLLARRTRPA